MLRPRKPSITFALSASMLAVPIACDVDDDSNPDSPASRHRLLVGDLDLDGHEDLVWLNVVDGRTELRVARGRADGGLDEADATRGVDMPVLAAALADTDDDGCLDLTAVSDDGNVYRLRGTCELGGLDPFEHRELVEVDGDHGPLVGALDAEPIFEGEHLRGFVGVSGRGELWCIEQRVEGPPVLSTLDLGPHRQLTRVAASRLDPDQSDDVLVLEPRGRRAWPLAQTSKPCRFRREAPLGGLDANELELEDVDWDGRTDLILGHRSGVQILPGRGATLEFGSAEPLEALPRRSGLESVAAIDAARRRLWSIVSVERDDDGTARLSIHDVVKPPLVLSPDVEPLPPFDPDATLDARRDCEGRDDSPAIQQALNGAALNQPASVQLDVGCE